MQHRAWRAHCPDFARAVSPHCPERRLPEGVLAMLLETPAIIQRAEDGAARAHRDEGPFWSSPQRVQCGPLREWRKLLEADPPVARHDQAGLLPFELGDSVDGLAVGRKDGIVAGPL